MSKVAGFIVGGALIAAGIIFLPAGVALTAAAGRLSLGLIIQGAALILTQAIADITQPHVPARQAEEMTIALGEQPRSAFFGEGYTAGSLVDGFNYGGKYGTDWEVLIIRLADHKCHSLTRFFVNDQYVLYAGDGAVPNYNGQLEIYFRDDTTTLPLPAIVTANGPGWTAADIGQSGCDVIVAYKADQPNAKKPIWPGGRPRFGFIVKGKLCYDPRKDDTVAGGSGAHRWSDSSTWEWSENAVVCRYNWVRGIYTDDDTSDQSKLLIGRGLTAIEAPPENIFAAANLCDEAGCTFYPFDSAATDGTSLGDLIFFSPDGSWMAHSYGASIGWWNVHSKSYLSSSGEIGFPPMANVSLAADGTAYYVTYDGGLNVNLVETPPGGTPVKTLTDAPTIYVENTRVLEPPATARRIITAYQSNTGYIDGAFHVAHAQSLRDSCITGDGRIVGLFHPSASSSDFTIEDLDGGISFTVTGSASPRSGPARRCELCHVASQSHFAVITDEILYLVDATTGAVKYSAATGLWDGGDPDVVGTALSRNGAEQKPGLTSIRFFNPSGTIEQWSLESGAQLQSVAASNWATGAGTLCWAYDSVNNAIWTRHSSLMTLLYLDRGSGFRVAGPVYSNQEFLEVEGMFAAACAGNLVTHEGDLQLEPAQAKSVVATITDDDLLSGSSVTWNNGLLSEADTSWINTVVANYIEPAQNWNAHDAPVVRDTADILADGKPREANLTLRFVRYQEQALRIAEIARRLGRYYGRAQITLGPRFCELEEADWIAWQSNRYLGGATRIFMIRGYQLDEKWQNTLTLSEIDSSAFDCGTFNLDYSLAVPTTPPPDIGTPEAGNWALTAVSLDSAGSSVPALEIAGSASDDGSAEEIIFEYWKSDGVTNPATAPDSIAWTSYGALPRVTTLVDITSVTGGAAYYAAVSYVVSGITGDRLVLGPVTLGNISIGVRRADTTLITADDTSHTADLG